MNLHPALASGLPALTQGLPNRWYYVRPRFQAFLDNLAITEEQASDGEVKHQGIVSALNRVYWNAGDGRRWLGPGPTPGTPAPRRPARPATWRPSAVLPVVEVQSQQPGNFPCTSMIVCAVASSFSSRVTFASSWRTLPLRGLDSVGLATTSGSGARGATAPPYTNSKGSRCLNDIGR